MILLSFYGGLGPPLTLGWSETLIFRFRRNMVGFQTISEAIWRACKKKHEIGDNHTGGYPHVWGLLLGQIRKHQAPEYILRSSQPAMGYPRGHRIRSGRPPTSTQKIIKIIDFAHFGDFWPI